MTRRQLLTVALAAILPAATPQCQRVSHETDPAREAVIRQLDIVIRRVDG